MNLLDALCKGRVENLQVLLDLKQTQLDQCLLVKKSIEDTNYALTETNQMLSENNKYLQNINEKLANLLGQTEMPDIKPLLDHEVQVDPPNETCYGSMLGQQYHVETNDRTYYAYSLAVWEEILKKVYPKVKDTIRRFRDEVADCDNWSLTMLTYVSIAFINANVRVQGSFAKALSGVYKDEAGNITTHAYNAFMTDDHKVILYEPQSGLIIGDIKQVTIPKYKTVRIDFLS